MIQKKSLKDAIQNPEIISVVGGLIGNATLTKGGLATSNMFMAAGNCFLTFSDRCLKIERDTSVNAHASIKITSFHGPSWSSDATPRIVLLNIPFDNGSIANIYAKNILDGANMKIYKDNSFNLYIKAMDSYSTIFVVEIIQGSKLFSNISTPLLTEVPDLESYELLTIH